MKTIRDEKNKQFELSNVKRKAIIKIEFTTKLDIFEKNYFQKVLMAQWKERLVLSIKTVMIEQTNKMRQ